MVRKLTRRSVEITELPELWPLGTATDTCCRFQANAASPQRNSGLHELAVPVDAHQQADADEQRRQRGAAVGDEGQGDADDGEDARHHAHVDEGVGEEDQRHRAGQQAREEGRRVLRGGKRMIEQQQDQMNKAIHKGQAMKGTKGKGKGKKGKGY